VVTEISLLEPCCEGPAGLARKLLPFGDPAGRLALPGSAVADGCGVDGRTAGAATAVWIGPVLRGRAVGTVPSAGWPAAVERPGWEAGLAGSPAAVAWPGMAA
jgi:hypothetical protein